MRRIARLRNPIMPYAWGSRRAIRALRGLPGESREPQAELWLGGHPKAASEVWIGGVWKALPEVVAANPEAILGPHVARRFGASLPFLLKVLAAGEPLSIQAHPDRAQAAAGFVREEAQGIPLTAPNRNYRDRGHKPEVIYALTPFALMRGFRAPADIHGRVARLRMLEDWPEVAMLARASDQEAGLRAFLASCLRMPRDRAGRLVAQAVTAIEREGGIPGPPDESESWLLRLAARYPDDPGALAPLWLQVTTLAPGEAVFTGPGVLHAYLGGTGIELMSSSDNVLRGGLTPKHIDIDELLTVLRFVPGDAGRVPIEHDGAGVARVCTPAEEMALSVITLAGEVVRGARASVEILLCTQGSAIITAGEQAETIPTGEAFLIPAAVPSYRLSGEATLVVASVPAASGRAAPGSTPAGR